MNNLKLAPAGRIIIFSDEETWTVDPIHNRHNDRIFGDPESANIITTTKNPASVMSPGFAASNGKAMPLIWSPLGFRLKAADYIDVLKSKFIPWVEATFPDGNNVLQQDGASAHTVRTTQAVLQEKIPFWPKVMWPPYSPYANPLDFAFWPHIEEKACKGRHAFKDSVESHWNSMDEDYIRKCSTSFRKRLEANITADGGFIEK